MRYLLGILLTLGSITGHAENQCESPTVVAEHFFRKGYNFYYDGVALNSLTPEFRAIVEAELKCSEKNGLCNLDYDPWTGAQDGEVGKPVRFVLESRVTIVSPPDIAIVAMKFPFVMGPKRSWPLTTHLILRKDKETCWLIHDFITPLGESLSYVLSRPEP